MTDLSLFPEVNPNLNEVAADSIAIEIEEKQTLKQNDIFLNTNHKVLKQTRQVQEDKVGEFNVKDNGTAQVKDPPGFKDDKPKSPSSRYPHLKSARAKGAITRKEKAIVRKAEKAAAKLLKDEEKMKRREATKERNRDKARERYRRIKAEKDESNKRKPQYIPQGVNQSMDFAKFSNYMMKYEGLKEQYKKQEQFKKDKHIERQRALALHKMPPQVVQKEFPDNYPLAHLYGVNRFKVPNFGNF